MMLSIPPDFALGARFAPAGIDDEAGEQAGQVEAPIEAVGEGGQVGGCVLAEVEGMQSARLRRLEIAQNRVDPRELRQFARLARADDDGHVHTAGIGDGGERVVCLYERIQ